MPFCFPYIDYALMSTGGMAPSQSEAEHKTSRKKKVKQRSKERTDISQIKKMHAKEFKSQVRRQMKRESQEHTSSEDTCSDKDRVPPADDIISVQSAAKSKREVRLQGGRESGFAKVRKEKRDSKSKEAHFGRRYGEQLMYQGEEKTKRRIPRQKDRDSGQRHHVRVKSNDPRDLEDCEQHDLKRRHKGQPSKRKNVPDTESFTAESVGGSSWKQESCWRRNPIESREQHKMKPHGQARNKLARGQIDGCKKRKPTKIVCKASLVTSEDSSCSDSEEKCNKNPGKGRRKTRKNKTKARAGRYSSFEDEEELCSEKGLPAIMESQCADESNGQQEPQETTSESEGNLEVIEARRETQGGESDSETDEKLKRRDKRSRPGKPTPGDYSEQSDAESDSENHSRSSIGEEGDDGECENSSEKDSDREGFDCEESKPRSKKDEVEMTNLAETESNSRERLLSSVRSKLPKVDLCKSHQGNHQAVENMSIDDKIARTEATCLAKHLKHKGQPRNDLDLPKQSTCLEEQANSNGSPSDNKNRMDAVALLAKSYSHLTSHSQILLNLKRKHKEAKAELLASGKLVPLSTTVEMVSDLEKTLSSRPKKKTTRNNKGISRAKESPESKPNLSTASGSDSRNLSAVKKKQVGKVTRNMALQQVLGEEENVLVEEEQIVRNTAKKDLTSNQTRSTSLSTFRKVTHWLSHKPPKKTSLKDRFLSLARAIGISGWLFKKLGRKKRRSKPFGFRRRMAIRIVSTAGMAKRCNRASSCDLVGEQVKEDLCRKGSTCSLLESDQAADGETDIMEEQGEPGEMPLSNVSCNKGSIPPQLTNPNGWSEEEKKSALEAKFAIVFPRVHQLVKSQNAALGSPGNSGVQLQSCDQSRRRAIVSVQHGCKYQHGLSMSNGQRNSQGPQSDASVPGK